MEELLLNLPERSRNSWREAPAAGASQRASGRATGAGVSFGVPPMEELTEHSSLTKASHSQGRPGARGPKKPSSALVSSNGLPFSRSPTRTSETRGATGGPTTSPAAPTATRTLSEWTRASLLLASLRRRSTRVTRVEDAGERGQVVELPPSRAEAV